jgi:ABC-2 type transport system permease protein
VNTHRVTTVIRRHAYVLRRSPHRFFDVTFWPFMDVLVFGSLGAFVVGENPATKSGTPYLLAGIMLFHVLFQVQIGVATGFLEETWSRNLLNVMTTPVTEGEYSLGIGCSVWPNC